jgi:hypothetical protein
VRGPFAARTRRVRAMLPLAVLVLAAGCASDAERRRAIQDVNSEFRAQYEQILRERGTRVPPVPTARAFEAMRAALVGLDMRVATESPSIGYLSLAAPAPLPLSAAEWDRAQEADGPKLCEVVRRTIPLAPCPIRFEPDIFDIVITATVREVSAGAEVSLTMRMREKKPPASGWPAREYAPPTAVRIGLDKIWARFEQELRNRQGATGPAVRPS